MKGKLYVGRKGWQQKRSRNAASVDTTHVKPAAVQRGSSHALLTFSVWTKRRATDQMLVFDELGVRMCWNVSSNIRHDVDSDSLLNSHTEGERCSSCPLTAQEYLLLSSTETLWEDVSSYISCPLVYQTYEGWSATSQLLWHSSSAWVSDLLTCTWRSGCIKKEQRCHFKITIKLHACKHTVYTHQCFLDAEQLEPNIKNENVTCNRQSDSRWTSKTSTWLVCYEPELVLSWVALSQVCDSQRAVVVFIAILHTTWIRPVRFQIHIIFSKPECFLNSSITVISSGWVCVAAAYFHCWSL